MSIELEIVVEQAIVDTPCDRCGRIINEGADCVYDRHTDEVFCTECADHELHIHVD